jgi:hypothetical protein
MFCPKCKTEYIEGIKMCADCKVPLVKELPPTTETVQMLAGLLLPDSGRLAMVFCTDDSYDFIKAAEALKEAGIPFSAEEKYTGEFEVGRRFPPPYRWAIFVDEVRLEDARDVLAGKEMDFIADVQMQGYAEGEKTGEIAASSAQSIENPKPRKTANIPEQSRIVVAGDGSFRKFILLVIVFTVIGTVIMLLRN